MESSFWSNWTPRYFARCLAAISTPNMCIFGESWLILWLNMINCDLFGFGLSRHLLNQIIISGTDSCIALCFSVGYYCGRLGECRQRIVGCFYWGHGDSCLLGCNCTCVAV